MLPDGPALADGHEADAAALAAFLDAPASELEAGTAGGSLELWGLGLWLATRDRRSCAVTEERPADGTPGRLDRAPFRGPAIASTAALADSGGLALLLLEQPPASDGPWTGPAGLRVAGFGPHGAALGADLAAHVLAWDQAGRPGAARLQVSAYPPSRPPPPGPDGALGEALVIERPGTWLAVRHT
jgi:protein-L-isoaspartate(D-aspartate) O-methyltransferase